MPHDGGSLSTRALLLGRGGRWPFAGHFHGGVEGGGVRLSWAGRVTTGGLDSDFRAARGADKALIGDGCPGLDRRRAIAVLWDRLIGSQAVLGSGALRLVVLLVAEDADGAAISGIGLHTLFAIHHGCLAEPWVEGPHPLLGAPGLPETRPGALTVESAPPWLIGVGSDGSMLTEPRGHRTVDLLPLCGASP